MSLVSAALGGRGHGVKHPVESEKLAARSTHVAPPGAARSPARRASERSGGSATAR